MNNHRPCDFCGYMILWDPSMQEKRKWREVPTNIIHTYERCKGLQKKTSHPEPERLVPAVAGELQAKIVKNLDKLDALEHMIKKHFENQGEKNPSPEKVGLYIKLLVELDKQ